MSGIISFVFVFLVRQPTVLIYLPLCEGFTLIKLKRVYIEGAV